MTKFGIAWQRTQACPGKWWYWGLPMPLLLCMRIEIGFYGFLKMHVHGQIYMRLWGTLAPRTARDMYITEGLQWPSLAPMEPLATAKQALLPDSNA